MSRIGKKPISVPAGVKVSVNSKTRAVDVEGPKGKLSFTHHPIVTVAWDESEKSITCTIPEDQLDVRKTRAFWGTNRSRINNMVEGVTKGYSKKLEIIGVGWNAKAQGKTLQLNIGFCHPVNLTPPAGVEFALQGPNALEISGADKQAVGQFAAVVRSKRKPEPYNGKGIKYVDEIIIRKQGKTVVA